MLSLTKCDQKSNGTYTAEILGPKGTIRIQDIVWITDRQDLLEIFYWESWAVLQGAWHCCLSVSGKVLLIEQQPRG